MANTFTTNYGWTKPEVGSDTNAWGTHLNANLDDADAKLFACTATTNAALPKAGGTLTGALIHAVGAVGTPSLTFAGDLNTGLYWIGADSFGLAANGALVVTIAAGAMTANGTFAVTGTTTLNGVVTANARVVATASVTGGAGLNIPPGVAPTSPVNGDLWFTAAGGQFNQFNGATQQVAYVSGVSSSLASLSTGVSTSLSGVSTGVSSSLSGVTSSLSGVTSSLSSTNSNVTKVSTSLAALPPAGTAPNSAGYRGAPFAGFSTALTFALADNGTAKGHYEATARAWTIPPVSSVPWVGGEVILIRNGVTSGNITLTRGAGVTLTISGQTTNQNVVLGPGAFGSLFCEGSDSWVYSGTGAS